MTKKSEAWMRKYEEKFKTFIRMCEERKGSEDSVVVVAFPEVLGDDYEELVESLDRLAAAGLMLLIVDPKRRVIPPRHRQ